ncbi:TAXI family TRAP transporter solute-binding subunit [Desulfobacterales bacterium HSG16]|nr:TAXI family TRAP transporter solute-binding subunit [Desulfobacterales bacterium HSG16]
MKRFERHLFLWLSVAVFGLAISGIAFEPFIANFVSDHSQTASGTAYAKKTKKKSTSSRRKKSVSRPKVTKFSRSSSKSKGYKINWSRKKKKSKTASVSAVKPRKQTYSGKNPYKVTKKPYSSSKAGIKPDLKSKKSTSYKPPVKTSSRPYSSSKAGIKPDLKSKKSTSYKPPVKTSSRPYSSSKAGIKPDLKSKKSTSYKPPVKTSSRPYSSSKAGIKPDLKSKKSTSYKPPVKTSSRPYSSSKAGIKPDLKSKKIKPKRLTNLRGSALDRQMRLRNSDARLKRIREKQGFGKPARISTQTIDTSNKLFSKAVSAKKNMSYKEVSSKRKSWYSKRSKKSKKRKKKWEIEFEFPLGNGKKLELEFGDNGIEVEIEEDEQAGAYGMYSTRYLNDSLAHSDDDPQSFAFMYNNWNNPGMKAYMLEMKAQSYDNRNLRQQLNQLETKIARLEHEGAIKNDDYLPDGVTPAIALAAEVIATPAAIQMTAGYNADNIMKYDDQVVVTIGTAPVGGLYNMFGVLFASYARGFRVEAPRSQGSVYNLKSFGRKFSIIVAQSDAVDKYLREHGKFRLGIYQFPVIDEYFQAVVNRNSKIKQIGKVGENTLIMPGPAGGGPAASWENVKYHAANGTKFWKWDTDKYAKAAVLPMSYKKSVNHLLDNPNAVLLYVGGLHSPLMEDINRKNGNRLRLIPFDENRFMRAEDREGNPVYNEQIIPSSTYPNLQDGWFSTSVKSLTIQMILAVHDSLFTTHPEIRENVEDALAKAIIDIQRIAGYER